MHRLTLENEQTKQLSSLLFTSSVPPRSLRSISLPLSQPDEATSLLLSSLLQLSSFLDLISSDFGIDEVFLRRDDDGRRRSQFLESKMFERERKWFEVRGERDGMIADL